MSDNNVPVISVIIPTHNRIQRLKLAIESALSQTFNDIEIIIISDASTDETNQYVENLCKTENRIRFFSYTPSKGGNYARNLGAKNAIGKYLAFLDDDDIWHKEKLERQLDIFKKDSKIGLVCTATCVVYDKEKYTNIFVPSAEYDSSKKILIENCIGSTTTVMVEKQLFFDVGGFDEKLLAQQDYDLWIRICQKTKIGVVKEPSVDYFISNNTNQISSYTNKYEISIDYMDKKYFNLYNTLSSMENKKRQALCKLTLAKRAINNKQGKLARKFIRESRKILFLKISIVYFISSFFTPSFVRRVKSILKG